MLIGFDPKFMKSFTHSLFFYFFIFHRFIVVLYSQCQLMTNIQLTKQRVYGLTIALTLEVDCMKCKT